MTLIKDRDIVIVGQQPWDTEIGSNCKNIALEFSRNNRVLYINSPLDRITVIRHKEDKNVKKRLTLLKGKNNNIELVAPNLWVYYPDVIIESINWIKIEFLFDFFNKRNNLILSNSIEKAILQLNFKSFILFNDGDIFRSFYLIHHIKPQLSIYYSRDNLLATEYWKYHGKRLEPKLMAKNDFCVANSTYLTNLCKQYNPNSYYVGQGCEVDLYLKADQLPVPDDIKGIEKPIIGYVGALISSRLNIEIINYIAEENPSWNIVLVGPEDADFRESILHNKNNVHFLGSKNPEILPAYIDSFTVCINPQLMNELTIGNYPRKIDEYLAAGKPVVATETEGMLVFKEYCYLAKNRIDYVELIKRAIKENSIELAKRRKEFASSHTWENSVEKIYDAIIIQDVKAINSL